jgi:hypothetical protein
MHVSGISSADFCQGSVLASVGRSGTRVTAYTIQSLSAHLHTQTSVDTHAILPLFSVYPFCDSLPRLCNLQEHEPGDILRKVRVFAAACGGRTTRSSGFDVMHEQSSSRALNMKLELDGSDLDTLPLIKPWTTTSNYWNPPNKSLPYQSCWNAYSYIWATSILSLASNCMSFSG